MADSSQIIKTIVTPSKVAGTPTPTEVVVDGDFEDWLLGNYPDDWGLWNEITDDPALFGSWAQSTDSNTGTYALELTTTVPDAGDFLSAFLTGVYDTAVASKTIQARFYAKDGTGTPDGLGVGAFYYDGANDYEWNLTAGAWIIKGSGDDEVYEDVNTTGSYAQYTSTQRTLPVGAQEFWINIVAFSSNDGDSVIIDDLEWLLAGADVASNGGFENWTEYANQGTPLDEWTFTAGGNWELDTLFPEEGSYINQTTDGGDNVVSMYVRNIGSGERGYIWQGLEGAQGETVDFSAAIESKTSDSQTGYFIALNSAPGTHTEIWDFVTEQWDLLATNVIDLPGTDNAKTLSGTGSFVSNDAGDITFPVSEKIVMVFMSDDGQGAAQYEYHFKLASAVADQLVGGSTYTGVRSVSGTDFDDMVDGDFAVKVENTVGDILFGVAGDGTVEQYDDYMDFSGLEIDVAAPVNPDNPVTRTHFDAQVPVVVNTTAVSMLGRADVDFKVATQTPIYTVPLGYTLLASVVQVETTVVNTPDNLSISSVGTAAGSYTDVATTIPQPSSTLDNVNGALISTTTIIDAGEQVFVNVSTPDTGTTLNGTVYLYGLLVPATP